MSYRQDQDETLPQFQANNHRQRRIIFDRTTADTGRLNGAVDDLRRRLIEHQAGLQDAQRAIRDLRSQVSFSSAGSLSPRRQMSTPSPPQRQETRSSMPSMPRIILQNLAGQARPIRENCSPSAKVAPIAHREREEQEEDPRDGRGNRRPRRQ